ncbi:dephospho-CoA kinase [Pandoraea apista]|uniref:Dephospho-CoA kinase n=1 Tax=Pandoraea apista TaxID=93218 RepID=A0A0B5FCQ2_9BURK|nr:dephospho-CoA kinase [Pandoraea apista]AJE97842.1 dephospho-CoA kinase [Pandoraea apista]AKH71832.1 dephospho-CoA kinase [Pandoraea apista]AKI64108.1 dephospho-CoA kinase [Pandoraea apista]ALS66770.1 dephospho-CoA kinase [Pandoraea apista]AVF38387.1 dephospho-CoA kinase [Pandoraea apista]
MTYAIGLTGGIGSGKTTIANLFATHGITIIDTDAIAHAITAPGGAAMPAIRREFGDTFVAPDGSLDRARMREAVFGDNLAKTRLEAITHPLIRTECERAAAEAEGPYLIFVVPLLVESGTWRQRVQRVLVVDCAEETQIARVMSRNHFTREQVQAIMARQATRAQRLSAADDVIDNDVQHAPLAPQVDRLHAAYLKLAAQAQGN